ncbi:MAG: metal ABC transporter substrate-binding protein [Christensenellales bacterium]|jgi:zinc transport system substrate-binding protein
MKRLLAALLCLGMLAGASVGASAAGERLTVYASFYPMYDFVSKIGGDKIDVINMVPSGMEPHDWEPTPSDIVGLETADMLIYNGAGMEHWVDDVLAALGNKDLFVVEASEGVPLLDSHAHDHDYDHDHDHDHGDFDPHVWLDPMNAKIEMENIKRALVTADPTNAEVYEANYAFYVAELDALDQEFKDALDPLINRDIVVAHQAYGYLCAAYGLNQVAIEGLSPDSEPSPARVAKIIDFGKAHNVKVIFFEELVSPKVAESIASAIGAQTEVLSPIEGRSDAQRDAGDDYFSIMRQNLAALLAALQ